MLPLPWPPPSGRQDDVPLKRIRRVGVAAAGAVAAADSAGAVAGAAAAGIGDADRTGTDDGGSVLAEDCRDRRTMQTKVATFFGVK